MRYYPLLLNLAGKLCVVIGAGEVAGRRVRSLLGADAVIRVVAPKANQDIRKLAEAGTIAWIAGEYTPSYLDGAFLAMTAADKRGVNELVAQDCAARGIMLCRADSPADGDFITPAVVSRGELTIAISTGGASPTLTAVMREDLQSQFGADWDGLTRLFGIMRESIRTIDGTEEGRKSKVRAILGDKAVRDAIRRGDMAEAEALARQCLS